jgi:hypothetical protein
MAAARRRAARGAAAAREARLACGAAEARAEACYCKMLATYEALRREKFADYERQRGERDAVLAEEHRVACAAVEERLAAGLREVLALVDARWPERAGPAWERAWGAAVARVDDLQRSRRHVLETAHRERLCSNALHAAGLRRMAGEMIDAEVERTRREYAAEMAALRQRRLALGVAEEWLPRGSVLAAPTACANAQRRPSD